MVRRLLLLMMVDGWMDGGCGGVLLCVASREWSVLCPLLCTFHSIRLNTTDRPHDVATNLNCPTQSHRHLTKHQQHPTFPAGGGGGANNTTQCKSLGHEYEPSKRTDSWLKVKKDYIEGLHDTLDLVPIAAWCVHNEGGREGVCEGGGGVYRMCTQACAVKKAARRKRASRVVVVVIAHGPLPSFPLTTAGGETGGRQAGSRPSSWPATTPRYLPTYSPTAVVFWGLPAAGAVRPVVPYCCRCWGPACTSGAVRPFVPYCCRCGACLPAAGAVRRSLPGNCAHLPFNAQIGVS